VQHAADAGAVAAIVYDDVYESLIIMSKPRGHPDPLIPSVFITQRAGLLIRSLMDLGEDVMVQITPVSVIVPVIVLLSAQHARGSLCPFHV
jgi:E3 ubiquitin-protein ligase RNF13